MFYFGLKKTLPIPNTRRVKGIRRYVTIRRKRFQTFKVYIFLVRITSRIDLAMSLSLPVWTLRSRKL